MSHDDDFAAFMASPGSTGVARLKRGQVVRGQVVQFDADSVFIALGTRSEGRIPALQLAARARPLQVGDTLEATVVDPDAPGGPLLALTLAAERGAGIEALALAFESSTPVQGKFTRAIKSGLEVDLGGVRGFCPASQLDLHHVADLSTLVGESARFMVIELSDEGRSVIVSRRKVLEQERAVLAADLRTRLRAGDELEGAVVSVQKYGAFVDLGGLEGLVHVSELSTSRVDHPDDVVRIGERVKVRVLGIESTDKGERIRLSMKALMQQAPGEAPALDEILQAEVVRLLPNGVLVLTPKGEGLVPVRELDLPPGGDHRRAFTPGQKLEVTLVSESGGRFRFSVRRVEEVRTRQDYAHYQAGRATDSGSALGGGLQTALSKLSLGPLPAGPVAPPTPSAPARNAEAPTAPPAGAQARPSAAAATPLPAATPSAAGEPSRAHVPGPSRRRIVNPR